MPIKETEIHPEMAKQMEEELERVMREKPLAEEDDDEFA